MNIITYKRSFADVVFLALLPMISFLVLWGYWVINPVVLLFPGTVYAEILMIVSILVIMVGVRKVMYDGKLLIITYGCGYKRILAEKEIKNITFQERGKKGAIMLVYLKNGKKFSRGLTGKNALPFLKELSASWN